MGPVVFVRFGRRRPRLVGLGRSPVSLRAWPGRLAGCGRHDRHGREKAGDQQAASSYRNASRDEDVSGLIMGSAEGVWVDSRNSAGAGIECEKGLRGRRLQHGQAAGLSITTGHTGRNEVWKWIGCYEPSAQSGKWISATLILARPR